MTTTSGDIPGDALPLRGRRVPVSRGMLTGGLLVLLGIWGGLVPFWGPQFGYAYTPDAAWTWTWGRLWLEVLPGAAAILSGLGLTAATTRTAGLAAGWLAAFSGAWFVLGPTLSTLWTGSTPDAGQPVGTTTVGRVAQEIGFFSGLGVAILLLAAVAIGRFARGSRTPGAPDEPR
ncbi:MAG TPA: hypothetical protein VG674_06270 [Amycolatopsis sp.]|nr:hypothetical protein [Amycolatopsis sp.]